MGAIKLASEVCMYRRKAALVAVLVVVSSVASWAQIAQTNPSVRNLLSIRPVNRVATQIDETRLIALSGSRHPLAQPENSTGEVPADQSMERMVLVLRPDSAQEQVLEELIRAQQDPASPYYHQWLTSQSFGKRFGISQNDLSQVVRWLQGHGMEVNEIPASRRSIVFSGSAGQVQSAFHTSIRTYAVGGESHYANATDPKIPQAFAQVIHGVVSLHDFRSAPQIVMSAPIYTVGNGSHFLAPQDWNTIYDVNPLYGQGLDGTGQSIAVLGRVDVAMSDVRTFRSNSGLPARDPLMIVNGPDPGFPNFDDAAESALDVEWAGAIARNATIKFVTSKSTTTDGIALSAQYAVNNNVAPIVSLSYGLCEAAYSSAGNAFWNTLWAQAASQGISVFVSSGDSGAAGCDSPSLATATQGRGVNALCTSPYSTCVGATQFNDVSNPDQYWSPTNGAGMSSALSYIPEVAWNESGWSGGLWSSGGGPSKLYSKPAWQNTTGVPADGMRDVPDVSMTGAIHDAYIIEIQGGLFLVAGTSAATPSLASVMALVLEKAGLPQGNVNPTLYALANLQYSAKGAAVFHDITSGNNSVPGVTGFNTGTGYDLATGLGSVDANLLVNHWSDRVAPTYTLTSSAPSANVALGTPAKITVTTAAGTGFNSAVALAVSGLPSKVTAAFSPKSVAAPGSGSGTLTLTETAGAITGTYNLTLTATGGGLTKTVPLSLTVVAPGFTLTSNVASANLAVGSPARITLTTAVLGGFNSAVKLSVSGLPTKVTAAFSPSSITAPGSGSSTLTLTETTGAISGTYSLTVTATGGGMTKTLPLSLTVVAPSFTIVLGGANVSVRQGGSMPVTVTTAAVNGFNSAIALSVSGLPAKVTASFSKTSIAAPGNGSSTLTLKAASGAAAGTSSLTVTGSGGGMTQTQKLTLTIAR